MDVNDPHKVILQWHCLGFRLPFSSFTTGFSNIGLDQLSHYFAMCSVVSVPKPMIRAFWQKSWQSLELQQLVENGAGKQYTMMTSSDVTQAISVGDFELVTVLHAVWQHLTAIGQDGPDYCRVDPAFGLGDISHLDHRAD